MEYGEEFGPGAADDITPNKILDMLVERAKTRGANGLIGVRIYRELDANKRPVWQASGVAVKFEDVPSNRVSNLPITSKNISKWISKIKSSC